MATWDLGILVVMMSIALGVAAEDTCIQTLAAEKILLIMGSSGMYVIADVEWY